MGMRLIAAGDEMNHRNCLALGFAVLSMLGASQIKAQITRAKVTGGEVQGMIQEGIASFKGIPFAAAPVGELRWKEPQPVKPWTDVRKAEQFGPSPMQDPMMAMLMGSKVPISEDCLYLNVWTGAKTATEKRPVMVWIYGGAFMSGMTSIPMNEGARLAEKGVVLVSIAYRVGPFGFLAHPELSRESGHGSGNYGLLDQIAGLRWVKDNIVQFGGDPNCVTIFGESAGGISVSMLAASPAAKGLFHRAISQSGGSFAPVKTAFQAQSSQPMSTLSLPLAESTGKAFLDRLGATDMKAARALSAEQIQKAQPFGAMLFWPVADGQVLLGDSYEGYAAGHFNDTPVLIGTNSDEGAMFIRGAQQPEALEDRIRKMFGPATEGILKAYPHANDKEAFQSAKNLFRDLGFAWPTWSWARLQTRVSRQPAYVYYFDQHGPETPDGANHAAEVAYVFHTLSDSAKADHKVVSDLMSSYWVNFARTGNPNGNGLPAWPVFSEKDAQVMGFDTHSSARPYPNLDKLKAVDAYFAWLRSQAKAASK